MSWRPFVSVLIMICTALGLVFAKMEKRRLGYSLLILSRAEARMKDEKRKSQLVLAKMTRPQRLQLVAQSRLTFRKPTLGQIVQMTDQGIALRQ